jgi:DNA-binding FrmR family transcriptional regulator
VDERTKAVIAQRLASASGHLGGVERMAREDASCIDVIGQIQAVQAALNKVSIMMLEAHLGTCILAAVQGEDIAERERLLDDVASIFEISMKYNYSIEGELHDNGN